MTRIDLKLLERLGASDKRVQITAAAQRLADETCPLCGTQMMTLNEAYGHIRFEVVSLGRDAREAFEAAKKLFIDPYCNACWGGALLQEFNSDR